MRLTCPACFTEYDVPDDAVAGRSRLLRCSFCGHQWRHAAATSEPNETVEVAEEPPAGIDPPEPAASVTQTAPPADPIIDAPPLTMAPIPAYRPLSPREDAQSARRPEPAAPPAPARGGRSAAITLLVLVVAAIVALAAHRPIAHAWPATTSVYKALGLK